MTDQHDFWRWCFDQKMTLVCYKEGSDEIIGTNLLLVKSINDAKKTITVSFKSDFLQESTAILKHHR